MTATSAPAISVVSVALDAERTIARTIESVRVQSCQPLEHIIIDGGSRDRTLEIVAQYRSETTRIISGKDRGIYDGMNRGLALARGEVVGFLNANDAFAHAHVLARIRHVFEKRGIDACYGNLDFVTARGNAIRRWRSSDFAPRLLRSGWVPPHPTFYCRRSVLLDSGGFKADYRIAGDYELLLRLFAVRKISVQFIPDVLVNMEPGGVSNGTLRGIIAANREVVRAWRENGFTPPPLIGLRKPIRKLLQLRLL